MQKLLLVNPELPYSFWSYSETCRMAGQKTLAPPLGILTVAGMLPKSWQMRLCDLNTAPMRREDWDFADTVLFTGMIVQRASLLETIREAKKRGKTVVVGGPYVTSVAEDVLGAGCDILLQGECEELVPQLLDALELKQDPIVLRCPRHPDMQLSPVPRFDLLRFDDYNAITIQTSRGCPFHCEFCDITNLYGRTPRYKSPEQVLQELETLFELGWRGTVFFCDDNFIGNKAHARALLELLIPWNKSHGEPFSFFTQASVNLGQDKELMDLMTEANFSDVFVGVETPDPAALKGTNKHQNVSNPLRESLQNMQRNGLSVLASFILGFDEETPGAGKRICEFVEELALPVVMLNVLQALPNTTLWNKLEHNGRLRSGADCFGGRGAQMNFDPARPEAEIIEEYLRVWEYLYEPSRFLARTSRYYEAMRPTRKALGQAKHYPHAAPKAELPFRRRAYDLITFARILWRQGIRASYRRQFWQQLVSIRHQNPSRFMRYISTCAIGENMFAFRKEMLRNAPWKKA